jgi:hypothetical protein
MRKVTEIKPIQANGSYNAELFYRHWFSKEEKRKDYSASV